MTPEGLVLRKRLFDLLSAPPAVRVVTAPSGFGKTTLLQSWVDQRPSNATRVVWVALSADVATRQDLWHLVVTSALRGGVIAPDAARELTAEIDTLDDPMPTVAEFLRGCGPLLVVLDAYERLRDLSDEIDDDIMALASDVNALEVVVTTRADTRLSDEVLIMRGLVRVIDEADLRFTTEEVEQLLEIHAPHAAEAAERIASDTRGYPLGVRAVAHGLRRLGKTPSFDSNAWQRLVAEDLKSQIADPALFDFVLDTSVPPYFDRELARELTGAEDIDRALDELAWNGFGRWIPYARERSAFQYVESVRDIFLDQLRADDPDRCRRDAGMAAAWLHGHDDHDLALALAIDARQYGLASNICRSLVLSNPDIYTTDVFERHLRQVPRSALPSHPTLAFIRAMVCAAQPTTRGSAAEYFRIAATHALDGIDQLSPRDAFYQHVGHEVCLRFLGHSREAAAAAEAGLALFDSMSAAERDELGDFPPMALSLFAYSLFQVGEVERAGTVVEQAVTSAVDPWWRSYALAFAACLHALNGRTHDAHTALAMTDADLARAHRRRRLPHTLDNLGRAIVRLDEFDFEGALREHDEIGSLVEASESWPSNTWMQIHARLGLGDAGAEAHRVEEVLTIKPPPLGLGPNLATAMLLDALAICWFADGNFPKGRRLLRTETPYPGQLAPARLIAQLTTEDPALVVRGVPGLLAEPGHTIRSTAATETLGAAAALRAGNDKAARELLERAASRHDLFGARAHLLYVPHSDLEALRELSCVHHLATCETYLAGPVASPISEIGSDPVLLTPREIEVLRAWAQHRTRADVAEALFVSPNTVRSQLNSAYHKLGVTTKDAAIQRAIELDLLHTSTRR